MIDVVSDSDDDVVLEKVVSAERALREEQDSEFERSLRLDALKASKRAREEEEKRAAEDAKRRRRERVEKQPKGGGIRIKFRMPEGSSLIGEFCGTATLDDLRDYLLVVAETSAPIHIDFVDAVARTRLVRPPLADSTLLVVDRDA